MSQVETPDELDSGEPETTDEPDPRITGDDDEEEAETTATVASRDGSAEVAKKLERAVSDQKRRLAKILDTDLDGCECPTCDGMGYTPGGLGAEPDFVHPDNLVACDACNGYGQIVTGSKHPSHHLAICTTCTGFGYITKQTAPATVHTLPTHPPDAQAAQAGTLLPDGRFLPFGATEPIVIAPSYAR